MHIGFRWGNLKLGDVLEDLDEDRMMILAWFLKKFGGRCGLALSGSGQGKVFMFCERASMCILVNRINLVHKFS